MDSLFQRFGFRQVPDKQGSTPNGTSFPQSKATFGKNQADVEDYSQTSNGHVLRQNGKKGRNSESRLVNGDPTLFSMLQRSVPEKDNLSLQEELSGLTPPSQQKRIPLAVLGNANMADPRPRKMKESAPGNKQDAFSLQLEELSEDNEKEEEGPRARQLREAFERAIDDILKSVHHIVGEYDHLGSTHEVDVAELEKVTDQVLTTWHEFAQDEFDDIMEATKAVECLNSLDKQHLELLRRGEGGSEPLAEAGPSLMNGGGINSNREGTGGAFAAELKDLGIRGTPPSAKSGPVPGTGSQGEFSSIKPSEVSHIPVSPRHVLDPVQEELARHLATLKQHEERQQELSRQIAAEDAELKKLHTEALDFLQKAKAGIPFE